MHSLASLCVVMAVKTKFLLYIGEIMVFFLHMIVDKASEWFVSTEYKLSKKICQNPNHTCSDLEKLSEEFTKIDELNKTDKILGR